jgi:cytochrome P450
MRRNLAGVPTYEQNIYSVDAIIDPYPDYQRLRDLGPVVWLAKQKVYALPRYAECKAVLRDDDTFLSGAGVALNRITNRLSRGTTLNSDGAEHDQRRKHLAHRMLPRALRAISDSVDATAAAAVDAALSRGEIDGVNDLAAALPLAVVPDLIGWPRDQRDHLIAWGGATFDVLGPLNWQAIKAVPGTLRMLRFARRVIRERTVIDGSMAHELLLAADEGKLRHDECPPLMVDYLAPSIDTTMSAISNALYLFATHPEQWQLLKDEPERMSNAINEVVRYGRRCGRSRAAWASRPKSAASEWHPGIGFSSCMRRPTATNASGTNLLYSTSTATPADRSASGKGRMPAPGRRWRAWRRRPC